MTQIEITFKTHSFDPVMLELLPYKLELIGFEGFCEAEESLVAYIDPGKYNRNALIQWLIDHNLPADCFEEKFLPDKNWNEEWEKNFEPVGIEGKCYIRAPFHSPRPEFPLEIVIEPKMSFGTGHHATTMLMAKEMLGMDFKNRNVFDAGCGTGILAILAEKLGAEKVMAIDIDEWSFRNALENTMKNNCTKIEIQLGDAGSVKGEKFDYILANINLNILVAGLPAYSKLLDSGGILMMSGILESDIKTICDEAAKLPLKFIHSKTLNKWALTSFRKK